ncbi:MAG: hypothetical protein KKI08_09485 [Armatimonadetes bacterium]|nr:hypothetical protein [Armatimonadota bacterium]
MAELDLQHLVALSRPVAEGFARVEPRPWDRSAVLLELIGEIGSLAHVVQKLEGFKRGGAPLDKLADECCDVIFIALRLAREDNATQPDRLTIPTLDGSRPSALILQMCRDLAAFTDAPATPEALTRLIAHAAAIAEGAGVDVAAAYEREMTIAAGFFDACGDAWPHPQPLRRPLATLRLWRLLWHRHSSPRT